MIVDIRTLPDRAAPEADLCIVGGGAAGLAMALRLAGTRLRVALVESGGHAFDRRVQELADGEQSGVPYFPLDATRYRLLGGSTFRWGARIAPMKRADFARRGWMPDSGWPISADTLAPYYDSAFELLGLHRPFDFDEGVWKSFAAKPPAFDPSVLQYCGFQFGKNLLLGEIHRSALRDARNLTVYLHGNCLEIRASARGPRVECVEVGALTGQRYTFKARAYVLACGGIENPRLLLVSNSVGPAGLGNESGLVGRYFMEHPTVSAGTITSPRWQDLLDVFSPGLLAGRLVEVGLALAPELQETRRISSAVARAVPVVTGDATLAARELVWQLRRGRLPEDLSRRDQAAWLARRLGAVARGPGDIVANVLRHAAGKPKRFRVESVRLEVRTEQEPNPDSRVTLAQTRDAFGYRRAHLHWALGRRDRETVQVAAEAFGQELRRLQLGELREAPWLSSDDAWPADLVGGHHHIGTTRMSDDPRTGVVDADCKVHTLDNLYVAGSSVFPTAGYVNPTAAILALALRLAEHLETRYA